MSSARKIAANRANAQHSTGPQTLQGKQKTRYNATRHGLAGKQVVIDGEDPGRYEALRRDLIDAYQPANAAELMLVEEIAQNYWRLQRARAMEAETFNLSGNGTGPLIAMNRGPEEFDRIRRYMITIERAYHRAIDQLQETQKLRVKLEVAGSVSQPPKTMAVGQASAPNHDREGVELRPENRMEPTAVPQSTARSCPALYKNAA